MREAEENLDLFWRAVDRELTSKSAISPRLRQLLSQRVLQRTREWVEQVKVARPETSAADLDVLTKPLSELHLQLE